MIQLDWNGQLLCFFLFFLGIGPSVLFCSFFFEPQLFVIVTVSVFVFFVPSSYAMDVNVERAEDVLTHKKLLELALDPAHRPAFAVRLVQVKAQLARLLLSVKICFFLQLVSMG